MTKMATEKCKISQIPKISRMLQKLECNSGTIFNRKSHTSRVSQEKQEEIMKLFQITAIMLVLVAALMTGCRNRNDTTVPSTRPSTTATTVPRQTSPSTTPTAMPVPIPSVTVPQGTDTSPATNGTDGVLNPSNGNMDKGTVAPRY
jgi:hypothetical protein